MTAPGTDGAATLADGEAQALVHGDRLAQLDRHVGVVAGHDHLGALGELDGAGHVGGAEVELRAVVGEERLVPAALLLGEHVDVGLEVGVGGDRAGLADHLARARRPPSSCHGAARRRCRRPGPGRGACGTSRRRCTTVFWVGRSPTISTSSPTLTMPCSILPVTTVPRPVMVMTSSTDMRKGLSIVAVGLGDEVVDGVHELEDLRRRPPGRRPRAP